ncbi:unnamed protein product [Mytilus coruscus]|uniref:Novel STAND NTPase 3 domain-containing protein n=1 Tax=Mytilus coruscus TaxID=42192 RepID=A0A6J8E769_MYTCO|nr:unnamed protein product [Mytilus coruscus]
MIYVLNLLLCSFLSASGAPVHDCTGEQCRDIISVPLIDEMKATLKADLDVSKLNNVLQNYILEEVTKAIKISFDIQMEKAVDQIYSNVTRLMQSDIKTKLETLQEESFKGSTFVRWGRQSCDGTLSSLVYKGYMAGPTYNARGSGSNYLCLTSNPQAESFPADWVSLPGILSGMGWELTGTDRSKSLDHIDDKDVPCAVCLTKGKTTLMIPGRTSCYAEWTKEYTGFLVSARNHNDAVTTEYVCADDAPEFYGSNNYNQGLIHFVEVRCGSIPCSNFTTNTSWDNQIPPTSTETTIGDDVERIRHNRNDIVHNVNTNISDLELEKRFSFFIDIARRLEVYLNKLNREYVSKIENVKICCIDPETEQLYLRQLEDLVERETTMISNISAVSHGVDELRQQNQISKEIEEWKIKDNKFVPTRASAYVFNILNKKSSATLTGSPGIGKTFHARQIALNFQSEGYRIIMVLIPSDIRDFYTPGKQTVFLVDDICGKFIANQTQLDTWQQMLPKIEQKLADNCCKIIATCRLQVYRDDKISLLEPLKICECNLNSKEMCLTLSEKTKIKEKYLGNRNLDDIAQASDVFLLLCSLHWLPDKDGIDVSNLFKSPFEFYKNELDNLNRCGKQWLEGRVTDAQSQVLEDVFMACRLNTGTPKTELMDALDTLEGSLISIHIFRNATKKKNTARETGKHTGYSSKKKREWGTSGSYPIISACFEDYIDIVRWLLENAVGVNQCRDDGNTSLYMACYNGHKYIVSLLLKRNHSISVFNENRVTPLFIACEKGCTEIVEALLKCNADVNINMKDGEINLSPLLPATMMGHYNIMKKLLEKNPHVNSYDAYGSTPLLIACEKDNMEMVRLLISNNANVDMRTYTGASAITFASANGNIEITRFLLESKADVNVRIHRKEFIAFKAMIRPSKTLKY